MRLALIIDDYLPHSTRVGAKMFHELACELFNNGHQVTVITPGFSQDKLLKEDSIDNITIWRFKSGKIKNINKAKRALNETLISYRAWKAINSKVKENTFDGIIYYSPSIFFGSLVKKIKSICECPSYLILRDLFPQWCIDSGLIKKNSLLEKYFRHFEKISYENANTIGLMSEKNIEVFESYNPEYKTHLLRNWASLKKTQPLNYYKKKLGLHEKIIYFYGGNIGHAQDMTNLLRLAKGMKEYKNAHFLFVGQGDEVNLVKHLIIEWDLTNTTLLPSINQDEFKKLLAEVDVGLFSLDKKHSAHNFPGKLLGYMVQSLPILGSVNYDNDLMPLINNSKAGYVHVNGNDDDLLQSAIELYKDHELRLYLGNNAMTLLKNEFDVTHIARSIVNKLGDQSCYELITKS
ncbi:glycosyltransferase [Providencia alcalifaciens]|uniref:Putative L-fucosamine transferase n=1 Tax=Providencia alcalifaciens TaxID=126385 RepID=A0A346CLC5_9GAMM|nr:glycosyltransferase family 4 protein [Providencia alcalifaciens]AXL96399.1 putative L-fucosamine transferase [Providencia alcalifaciens]MTC52607.1 glycosyltransferase [Providencia alcalifaciens]